MDVHGRLVLFWTQAFVPSRPTRRGIWIVHTPGFDSEVLDKEMCSSDDGCGM